MCAHIEVLKANQIAKFKILAAKKKQNGIISIRCSVGHPRLRLLTIYLELEIDVMCGRDRQDVIDDR